MRMMYRDAEFQSRFRHLKANPRRWLVTGCAGFIGSHLVEALLELDQQVVGLDNFATGSRSNLEAVTKIVGPDKALLFRFVEGDIRNKDECLQACSNEIDVVLHQAALGSVPRSIKDPETSNAVNVGGFVTLLNVLQQMKISRFVYASSSSVYGENPELPRRENQKCEPLSPYAASKMADEIYARAFASCFGITTVGLRYFNVFGPRQNPDGPYAAVIPLWVRSLIKGETVVINGDGETSRDFCFVHNVVEANLLAATADLNHGSNHVINIACGGRTTLNQLYEFIAEGLKSIGGKFAASGEKKPVYKDFRAGDVRHSHADVSLANKTVGYEVRFNVRAGLAKSILWYSENLAP